MDDNYHLQFLLYDYRHHTDTLRHVADAVITRVNTYFAIVSVILSMLAVLFVNEQLATNGINYVICLILFICLCIGFLIYAEMTQWVINSSLAFRQIAGIRQFIFEHHPFLVDYLNWDTEGRADILSQRRTLRRLVCTDLGPKQIVTILNNTVAATIWLIFSYTLFGRLRFSLWIILPASILVFIGTWVIQFLYSTMRYKFDEQMTREYINKMKIRYQKHGH